MENRIDLSKETLEKLKKERGYLAIVKETLKKFKPPKKFAGATVYKLGEEHLLVLFLDEEENPLGDMLIDLKNDVVFTDPHQFKVKIEITPQGMEHYKLWEGNKYFEGKATLLTPWISYEEIYS
ncbi:MAG: hypothetical protein GXO21_02020 [Aquificae bacterium]|nr:hypothetical protein [Aquificota bacterium]